VTDQAWGILLRFDTDSPDFARGFETGRIWQLCRADPDEEIVETVHITNTEMLLRIAEATGRTCRAVELDDVFVEITFYPVPA
jgi:hypothetical protein